MTIGQIAIAIIFGCLGGLIHVFVYNRVRK
jgi:hypothetical protein